MKPNFLFSAAVAVSLLLSGVDLCAQNDDWCNFKRYQAANEQVTEHPKAVLMGNSITDFWFAKDREFFTEHRFVGRGISGQTSSQILLRFREDVIALHPKYVVILAGVNDIALNKTYVSLSHTFGNIVSMCDLAIANGIRPVICTAPPAAAIVWRPEAETAGAQLRELNRLLREYARKHRVRIADYAAVLAGEDGTTSRQYSEDGIHPNAQGYKVMEEVLLKALK